MENTIIIQNLNKYYGKKQALSNVNLTIERGMFGLLGRNGAGKTTLMKTLATLLHKNSGNITVCGVPIENAKEIRKIVGYLPQEFSMYPTMSVYETMDYLGLLSGIGAKERKRTFAFYPIFVLKVPKVANLTLRTHICCIFGEMVLRWIFREVTNNALFQRDQKTNPSSISSRSCFSINCSADSSEVYACEIQLPYSPRSAHSSCTE